MQVRLGKIGRQRENTIALINIVFLMLVFFMLAGTIAPAPDMNVDPVMGESGEPQAPEGAISLHSDGTLYFEGNAIDPDLPLPLSLEERPVLILYPDRNADARRLIEVISQLGERSGKPVRLMVRRQER